MKLEVAKFCYLECGQLCVYLSDDFVENDQPRNKKNLLLLLLWSSSVWDFSIENLKCNLKASESASRDINVALKI